MNKIFSVSTRSSDFISRSLLPLRGFSTFSKQDHDVLSTLKGRNLLRIDDYSHEQLKSMLALSHRMKEVYRPETLPKTLDDSEDEIPMDMRPRPMSGLSMACIFQKRSTRTRVSTETGMNLMGGYTLFLSADDIQLGVNESVKDTASVLSRFNSLILARVYGHAIVADLGKYSSVPVINALSDMHHPLQTLADVMTMQQRFGDINGRKVCYVGDGNNIAHDLLLGCALMDVETSIASPQGYEINSKITDDIKRIYSERKKSKLTMTDDPQVAVKNSDVIVTDTWVSMGQEKETQKRLKAFEGYQVTMKMAANAKKDWVFLHCLPRHKEEVDDEVFYSQKSLVFNEAENRMYTVMAVIATAMGKTSYFISK